MISIARIFGAPVIEPPGNDAASRSNASRPSARAARSPSRRGGGRPPSARAAQARHADAARRRRGRGRCAARRRSSRSRRGPWRSPAARAQAPGPPRVAAARPRPLDRVGGTTPAASTDRNGSGEAERSARGRPARRRAEVEVRREQRRVAGPQAPVERPRVAVERRLQPAGQVGLVDVAARDVAAHATRHRARSGALESGPEDQAIGLRAAGGRRSARVGRRRGQPGMDVIQPSSEASAVAVQRLDRRARRRRSDGPRRRPSRAGPGAGAAGPGRGGDRRQPLEDAPRS